MLLLLSLIFGAVTLFAIQATFGWLGVAIYVIVGLTALGLSMLDDPLISRRFNDDH